MNFRVVIFALLLFGIGWIHTDARNLDVLEVSVASFDEVAQSVKYNTLKQSEELCTLCELFTAEAAYLLAKNMTQIEIMTILLKSCSLVPSYEVQCTQLVEYYGTLFFLEIARIRPDQFCEEVNLCHKKTVFTLSKNNEGTFCHNVLTEVLAKLKDLDTEIEVIELLLNACKTGHRAVEPATTAETS